MPGPSDPCLLAFDTATVAMAVALHAGGRTLTLDAPGGAEASRRLLPAAEELLRQAGIGWRDLSGIGFGRGPGAFTGLRTACAAAQGLAFGLGLPVVAVDSLLIVGEDARRQLSPDSADFEVAVAMDARMGQAYAARYRRTGSDWQVIEPPALLDPGELRLRWRAAPGAWHAAGSALVEFADTLAGSFEPARACTLERGRAAALMALVQAGWAGGGQLDAAEALPLYLRDKVALTTAERAAARAGAAP